MPDRLAKKVLLVGWDAADWQVITPLIEAGLMPTLASFLEGGVMGNLSTVRPILSPMLWNSIATGKRADKHGILGFVEPKPDGTGIQAVSSTSRKTKALWNILSQNRLKSNVVSWYASHPAEPIDGVCVSEHYARVAEMTADDAPPPPQSIHPPRLIERLTQLRVRGAGIGAAHIAPFVPTLGEIPPAETPPVTGIQKMLARCATVHAAATEIMEHEPWDFMAVYYETIDHFCHAFMQYHPPRMPHVREELFERYKGVVAGIYRFHDMMLERLLQLAGDDATVIICSDHGFLNDHLRPVELPGKPAGPEAWHRFHGMFAMRGPGILKDERVYGANVLDVAPTILTLLGLPVGRDMDGKVLAQCFERPPVVERIESWDKVEGDAGLHPPDLRVDPFDQAAALQQLIELGYVAAPDASAERTMKIARDESQYNLAVVHIDAGRPDKAATILEALHAENAGEARYAAALAHAYLSAGRLADCRRVIDANTTDAQRSPSLEMMLGEIEFADGNTAKALEHLTRAEQAEPRLPTLHCQIGNVYLKQRRWPDARRAFEKALSIDGDAAMAYFGLGNALLHMDRAEEAVEATLKCVGLMHYFPRAHYQLGQALVRMGQLERAVQAFQTAVHLRPAMPAAHRYLAALHMKLGDAHRARRHSETARRLVSPPPTLAHVAAPDAVSRNPSV